MTGGFIVARYDNVFTSSSDDIMGSAVCSPGIRVNAEISVIGLSWCTSVSCSWNCFVVDKREVERLLSPTL